VRVAREETPVYHTFRIQLALDLVASGERDSLAAVPLMRAIPGVATVPLGMHVQWFVQQEDQFAAFVPDPESSLVWAVRFDGPSPFRDESWQCALKTTAIDLRTPLVHAAEAEPIRIDARGRFDYEIWVAERGGRTISSERAVLIVP
jgi:hypothetical protein